MLVAAVLRPECGEYAQLGERRRAPEHLEDASILEVVEVVLPDDLGSYGRSPSKGKASVPRSTANPVTRPAGAGGPGRSRTRLPARG